MTTGATTTRTATSGGAVVWLTGLPASGKTTLAAGIDAALRDAGVTAVVLDGDEVRAAMVPPPGHDERARDRFYRSLAGLAAMHARRGVVVVVAATAHRRVWRELARSWAPRFLEVHVATPLVECRHRDPKGLYTRAESLPELPGVGVPFEPPEHPDVISRHGGEDERAIRAVLEQLGPALAPTSGMRPFHKILCPVDFSPHSDEALRVACSLAETFDAPLTLVHVFSLPVYPTPDGAVVSLPATYAEMVEAVNTQLEKMVATIRRDHGAVRIDARSLEGVAFREIVSFARANAIDLVVMGTHGRTGIKHALLGSVAEKVVRKAPCAVLTVRLPGHTFEHP